MPKISRFRAIDIAFSRFRPTDREGENTMGDRPRKQDINSAITRYFSHRFRDHLSYFRFIASFRVKVSCFSDFALRTTARNRAGPNSMMQML
jgi:hypothetical protein